LIPDFAHLVRTEPIPDSRGAQAICKWLARFRSRGAINNHLDNLSKVATSDDQPLARTHEWSMAKKQNERGKTPESLIDEDVESSTQGNITDEINEVREPPSDNPRPDYSTDVAERVDVLDGGEEYLSLLSNKESGEEPLARQTSDTESLFDHPSTT